MGSYGYVWKWEPYGIEIIGTGENGIGNLKCGIWVIMNLLCSYIDAEIMVQCIDIREEIDRKSQALSTRMRMQYHNSLIFTHQSIT